MVKGISIGIASETREFSSGVKRGVIEPLEDVADALDDLERSKAGDKVEKSLEHVERGADKAKDSVEDIGKEAKSLGDIVDRESKSAGRNLGDNIKDGTDKGTDGFKDMKSEAGSTAKEAAASFSDIDDAGSALQEGLANVFTGFGPAGAIAGGAAAIGLGLAMTAIEEQKQAVDELKQKFADAYQSAAEEGRNYLDAAQIIAAANEIIFDPEQRKAAVDAAKTIGVDTSTYIKAMAGDQDALTTATAAGLDAAKARGDYLEGLGGRIGETNDAQSVAIDKINGKLGAQKDIQDDNSKAALDALKISNELEAAERRKTGALSANYDLIDRGAERLAQIPTTVTTKLTLDTSGAEAAMSRFVNRDRTATVTANVIEARTGRRVV